MGIQLLYNVMLVSSVQQSESVILVCTYIPILFKISFPFRSWITEQIPCMVGSHRCCLVSKSCLTLQPHGMQPTRLLCPWNIPGKNTRWVSISFSRGSSHPKHQIHVSCLAGGRFFTTEPPGKSRFSLGYLFYTRWWWFSC